MCCFIKSGYNLRPLKGVIYFPGKVYSRFQLISQRKTQKASHFLLISFFARWRYCGWTITCILITVYVLKTNPPSRSRKMSLKYGLITTWHIKMRQHYRWSGRLFGKKSGSSPAHVQRCSPKPTDKLLRHESWERDGLFSYLFKFV